ncbi:MAG: phosphatidylserine decarboxylase family protein [Crocinitomicaceae bacterium]|jgi:phosphatidylserine decarboxylase|nr:phosphatidylserine decarboxylase family protein [Crocinitomicaceae bacterium]MCF8434503.1 phosphatidylserine decarboxylase family protein [Crocinitomicaceae bacterium]MDP4684788.1 phosphatidylserine decarboxylase family protein [Crocinitomicaceae bacterium]MDP4866258.1 phosphatidylserine decarboxylase family protein [Crocinitomicaceae bacterium]MDP5010075.1 phosphatidylserine decarboxylase family protein [Crocinitomicaceae bacterium]
MTLHREGYLIMAVGLIILSAIQVGNYFLFTMTGWTWLFLLLSLGALVMAYLIIQFFRVPSRVFSFTDNDILCPADGKVVVIEEVTESEYFKDRRIQVSIFMSPMNVHANYNPISGLMKYVKYHPGLFLVAWHPKSSTDNERTTMVIEHSSGKEVLFRQIAGAVARRICYYVQPGQTVKTGDEFGFIKFGSRVDVLLPLDCKINVKIGDTVKAKLTKLGELN